MRRPDFFIVGAAKCGTTALYEYLNQHPDIFMPDEKEPQYFCPDLNPRRRSEKEYLQLFARANDQKRIGEASSSYLYSELAAGELRTFCPAARIIIMLRNPVDMLQARHAQMCYHCMEDIKDFGEALAAEQDRKEGRRSARPEHSIRHLFYRETAKYAEQIQRYVDLFPADQIKIIIFDDFQSNTASVYRDLCEFLDVDSSFAPTFRVVNENRRVRNRFLQQLLEVPGPLLRKIGRPLTPRALRHKVMKELRQINSTPAPRNPLDIDLRRALQAELRPEVMRLSQLLKRDLSHWCD